MVDMEVPSGYVEFLRSMAPTQPRSELYTMLGLGKQGKTLFFRDLLQHLHHSSDAFVEAPGIRGQVMLVFTLPSYPVRLQGDQGRVRARQGHRPGDGRVEVRDGEARRPRRPAGRHARVHRPRAAARAASRRSCSSSCESWRRRWSRPTATRSSSATATSSGGWCRSTSISTAPRPSELEAAVRRLRQRDPRPRDRQHLPRRHALAELRRHPLRPRRLLRLRRDRVPDRRQLPPHPAGAGPRGRAGGASRGTASCRNDVFPEEFATFLLGDPRLRELFLRHHADLLEPEFWQEASGESRRRGDRLLPVPGVAALPNRHDGRSA